MPKYVRCNIEDHRLMDGKFKCEDVTKIDLPTIEHPTTSVKSAGMVMDVDIPNIYHYNAMEIAIHHNNGTNCKELAQPGIHHIELRAARQNYVTSKGEVELEVVKVRVKCVHKSTEKGSIETDNPYGSTEKYSVLRYEEEWGGKLWNVIDSTSGSIVINGKDYGKDLNLLLD